MIIFSKKYVVILFMLLVNFVEGYKILVFFPYPGKSHAILGAGYVRHLIKAGHNVTFVTPVPIDSSVQNLRQIDVASNFGNFPLQKGLDIKKVLDKEVVLTDMGFIYDNIHDTAAAAVKHEKVQKLILDETEEFDVAIVQWLFTELFVGVAAVFKCPYIWSSSMEPHSMVIRLIDQALSPAYTPGTFSLHMPPFSFTQRVSELWDVITHYKLKWWQAEKETKVFEEAFGPALLKRGGQIPSLDEVRFNASMILGNSHVSVGLPLNLPLNYIPIAGYHINEEVSPLPENLKKIMDKASHGVIYFSLGTMFKGKSMPEEMKIGFIKTFSELKQTVIWKLEVQLQNLPENVHVMEWTPQNSILAHPNTILFITHGGLLSSTEAVHFGVPIIGIPMFADQFLNIHRAVARGYGIRVPLSYNTPVDLKAAIKEIISQPKYREKVKELSLMYHDRPVSPGKELVHWVEHVVKTRGARHLRSISSMVPWYQKLYLDLLALVFSTTAVLIIIIVNIIRLLSKKHISVKNKRD